MLRPSPTKLLAMLCLFCLLAGAMTRCTSRPVQPYVATEPRNEAIYVIVGGWHTELALPMPAISVRLAALKLGFGNARYLVFGWGARDYYMSRDPGLEDLLRAAVPGPAVARRRRPPVAVPVGIRGEGRGRDPAPHRRWALSRKRLLCLDRNLRSRAHLQHLVGRGAARCRVARQLGGCCLCRSAHRAAPAASGGNA